MNDPPLDFSALLDSIPGPSLEVRERLAARLDMLIEAERASDSLPSRRRQPGLWTHRVMVVAVAAVILAVFFVPLPHVSLFKRLVTPAKVSTSTSTPTLAPVEIQLVLDRTQVTAGTPIRGEALLTNTTGRTITVQTCAADGWLSVGLTNQEVSYKPLSPLIACSPTVRLLPGLNRFPITISSVFQGCTQTSSQATPQLPACTSRGAPPLPAGQYLTKIVTTGLPAGTRLPSAIKVTLLGRMRTTDSAVRCSASNLRVVLARKIGAAGTGNYYFTATNHGKTTCTIKGFFQVIVLGAHRRLLSGNDRFTATTASGRRLHVRPLLVKPRSSVTTMVSILENPMNGAATCPYITAFLLRAPNSEATAHLTVRVTQNWFCGRIGSKVTVYATLSGKVLTD
jgi:hypothetical protein